MTSFLFAVISGILSLLVFAIIASAILSWLVAFNVINIRHPTANAIVRFLEAVTRPVLAPFQRFIPSLGGIDISPIVAILVIQAANRYLLPWLFNPLYRLIG
ncbi:MAG: YggT family protein [Spirochaetaceae bacterium]|nr:YggT family protein [Spirochaetaceae bacterium]